MEKRCQKQTFEAQKNVRKANNKNRLFSSISVLHNWEVEKGKVASPTKQKSCDFHRDGFGIVMF